MQWQRSLQPSAVIVCEAEQQQQQQRRVVAERERKSKTLFGESTERVRKSCVEFKISSTNAKKKPK